VQQRQVDVDFRHQPILPRRQVPIRPPLVQQQRSLHWSPNWMRTRLHRR
jgi:hypothetical protein